MMAPLRWSTLRATCGIVGALMGGVGCSDRAVAVMTCAASELWPCPRQSVNVERLGANTYRVTGCGHDEKYFCKGPTDGCMTEDRRVLDTRACLDLQR
jgi:hypothetical protein